MSKTEKLAAALLADRDRDQPERTDITKCFMCGHGMMCRGSRFCSDRCRGFYDAGEPAPDQDWRRPRIASYRDHQGQAMKPTTAGFKINCAHCRKEFESLGCRYCSTACERGYREHEANLAVMAEVGIEAPKPKRTCEQCEARIPTWRNGRKVSSATRFCSPKCARKAKGHDQGLDGVLVAETIKIAT